MGTNLFINTPTNTTPSLLNMLSVSENICILPTIFEGVVFYPHHSGEIESVDSSSDSSVTYISVPDRFREILIDKSLVVRKDSCKSKYHLKYHTGFFVLKKTFLNKTIISVKDISSCYRINYTIAIDTENQGLIMFHLENLGDAIVIENTINGFIDGVYGDVIQNRWFV